MSDLEIRVEGSDVQDLPQATVAWSADDPRVALVITPNGARHTVVVEGAGSEWAVTVGGRRLAVSARTWRERVLAEAESAASAHHGPLDISATLPGLVVAIEAEVGAEVEAGDRLLTIEAMKMQNEVRAPRAGKVLEVAVAAGQAVATGALLLRLE